ncbi:GntR family transcriptional regulator [Marinobacter daepoensis]|uniref:UTRA domain-containing protein n=1 Tax=Marinobacter daepoensis TaxID=262077 RepID=A0ABS3BE48_9GAMM|nr:UTRA domain-containing protein [Marinobacter daepoensis]MBN7769798.1 UTRA domain-containing protein [Marinobacter daepoensis]MBY6078488.1 GntR family transcriptional regulator [Marinobacter daepoensis]
MQERECGESAAPLYLRVRDQLASKIEEGSLAPNTRLPSERILAEEYGTTRVTARLALAQLEREGRLFRSNRRGWFVSPPRLIYKPAHDYSFSDYVTAQGRVLETETLDVTPMETSPWLAAKTGLSVGDPIVLLRRRRQIDGRPVLVENIYLNPERLPNIATYDFNRSLWKLLREKYDVELRQKRIEMYPTALVEPQASDIGVTVGTAGLYVTRCSRDAEGRFVELDEEFWLHDALSIQVDVD